MIEDRLVPRRVSLFESIRELYLEVDNCRFMGSDALDKLKDVFVDFFSAGVVLVCALGAVQILRVWSLESRCLGSSSRTASLCHVTLPLMSKFPICKLVVLMITTHSIRLLRGLN